MKFIEGRAEGLHINILRNGVCARRQAKTCKNEGHPLLPDVVKKFFDVVRQCRLPSKNFLERFGSAGRR